MIEGKTEALETKAQETGGHVEVTGSSGITFDELESVDAAKKVEAKREAKKEVEKEKAKDELTDKKTETKKADKKDKPDTDKSRDEKTEVEAKETKEEAETTEETAENSQKVRTYRTKSGEETIAIRSDAKFKVKVDGKEEEITLADALTDYSGRASIQKRLGELGNEKGKFLAEQKQRDYHIKEITSHFDEGVKSGNFNKAIARFAEAIGADPQQAVTAFSEATFKMAQTLAQLPEEQRSAQWMQMQAEQYKSLYQDRETRLRQAQQRTELDEQISKLTQENGITDEQFDKVAEELLSLKESGKIKDTITPEMIIRLAKYDQKVATAKGMIGKVNQELMTDSQAIEKVISLLDANLTEEEVFEFVTAKYGDKSKSAAEIINDKLRKTKALDKEISKAKTPQNEDMWSFDHV